MALYLPSQSFQPGFTFNERIELAAKYNDPKWEKAIRQIGHNRRCLISKSAIKVAKTIKERLNIELFPLITPIACKGFDLSGGTFAFSMIDENGDTWCFEDRANKFYSLKGNYYVRQNNSTELLIGRND